MARSAGNPMMEMMMKGLGIDPAALIGQARGIGEAFNKLQQAQEAILASLSELHAKADHVTNALWLVQLHMGIATAPQEMAPEMLQLIADESRVHMGRKIMDDPLKDGAAMEQLENILKLREGVRLDVYYDTARPPRPTVGIGHLVTDADRENLGLHVGVTISQDLCDRLFREDARGAMDAAVAQCNEAGISAVAAIAFLPWLASVNFQLGVNWTKEFGTTWAMIVGGRYNEAALHLATTAWYDETPVRVADFANALRALPPKQAPIHNTGAVTVA